MEIPKQIKVGAYTYDIVFVDEFGEDNNPLDKQMTGLCNPLKYEISILNGLNEMQKNSTFVHEVIEAINEHMGVNMSHRQIVAIECGLMQVFFT